MNILSSYHWTPLFIGLVGGHRIGVQRPVRIERGRGSLVRVIATSLKTDLELAIVAEKLNQLEEMLLADGGFNQGQAAEIIRRLTLRDRAV